MSLRGVGIDVVDLTRFADVLERHGDRLRTRWFAPAELAQAGDQAGNLARSFAVKEAVWKALRLTSIRHLVWRDIVAVHRAASMDVTLTGIVLAEAQANGIGRIHVDTTIRDHIVLASAIIESSTRRRVSGPLG